MGFEFGILAATIFLIFKSEVTIFGKEVDLKEVQRAYWLKLACIIEYLKLAIKTIKTCTHDTVEAQHTNINLKRSIVYPL